MLKSDNDTEMKIQVAKKLAKNKKYVTAIDLIRHILVENFADTKPMRMREAAEILLEEKIPHEVFRRYYYRHIKPIIKKMTVKPPLLGGGYKVIQA